MKSKFYCVGNASVLLYWDENQPAEQLYLDKSNWKILSKELPAELATKIYHLFTPSVSQAAAQIPGVMNLAKHPVTGLESTIFGIIMNLNDYHKWTRNQIADWLETLDDQPRFI